MDTGRTLQHDLSTNYCKYVYSSEEFCLRARRFARGSTEFNPDGNSHIASINCHAYGCQKGASFLFLLIMTNPEIVPAFEESRLLRGKKFIVREIVQQVPIRLPRKYVDPSK